MRKLPWKEIAKANRNVIVNHKGEEHEQQIVSDSMYKHNDIVHSIVLTIQKVCRLDFLQVLQEHCC